MKVRGLILGISCFFHDSAVCLLGLDGSILAAAQEERFTRVKHDPVFPVHAINYCLQHAGIEEEDIGSIVFYEDQDLALDRVSDLLLRSPASEATAAFQEMCPSWTKNKLDIPRSIQRHLPHFCGEVLAVQHHQAHAASALYPSPFEEAAILTIDGVGE
jgi:carbamoyltransferase